MFVYKIENKINGKMYIGITSRTVEERFKEHVHRGYVLHQAVAKYGEEAFEVETLAEAFDENEMKWLEKKFIEKFNTMAPNGYNLTLGGDGTLGHKHSEETKRKMSEAKKGSTHSEEAKRKLSKPIICLETGIEYPSAVACAEEMGLHRPNITAVLKGRLKTTKGFTFKYKEE